MLAAGCANSAPQQKDDSDGGGLVHAERLRSFSADEVTSVLNADGFDSSAVRFGVDTYALEYRTVDPAGRETTATGLLALPHNDSHDLTVVAYQHGTMATKAFAPSVAADSGDLAATISYAGAGFAAVAPDYLGLGRGPGSHPYMDVPSETTASLDMLRAARTHAGSVDRQFRHEVDIVGFSQGGPASMALAGAIQGGADAWFHGAAVAAISGPFDLRAAEFPALLNNSLDPTSGVFYASYLLVAWQGLHGLYGSPSEVFKAPYDGIVTQLFDGSHTDEDIVKALPQNVDELLTPHGIDMLRNPTGAFSDALQTADSTCGDWTPKMPVRLFTGSKDRDVATDNSAKCQAALREHGVDAPVTDLGPVDHGGSGKAGTGAAVHWFMELAAAK
ncbi:hypothetical protein OG203_05795 [Nocardia sp. NBC_01499]|uniref:alpha/beta hydrolase family protein n=1 Tax=Nocardia sp. NBC_01499 TaxID=2903597 RepID=UPI00386FEEBA